MSIKGEARLGGAGPADLGGLSLPTIPHCPLYHSFGYLSREVLHKDPLFGLLLDALARVVEAGAEAEWADQAGDRERFWAARRRMLKHQAIAWTLSEVIDGRS